MTTLTQSSAIHSCSSEQKDMTPHDCALLVGIPSNLNAFKADLEKDEDTYASFVVSRNRLADRKWLDDQLCQHFRLIDLICCEVEELGVAVYREACLSDLTHALETRSAITLLFHTHAVPFQPNQISDTDRVIRILNDRTTIAKNTLPAANTDCETARRELSKLLQKLVSPFPLQATFDRPYLEDLLGDALAPARFIELCDGTHCLDTFLERVPVDFKGVFDLSLCRTTQLGNVLKKHRVCSVINEQNQSNQPVHSRHRLIRYKLLIHVLQHFAQPYGPALQRLAYP